MAGIDNNTLLYLRGDSFSDLSLYNKTLSNNGCIIEDKSIKINAGNYINIDYDSNLLDVGTGDFTVSFNFKPINQITNHYIIAHQWANNNKGYAWGVRISNNQLMLLINSGLESITYYSSDSIQLNSFAHYELCRKNGLVMIFINGKKIASFNYTGSLLSNTNRYIYIGKIERGTIGNLEGFLNNVFISKKCLHTEDFTPQTQPYNSITINKTNQTDTNIEFSIEKLGQEVINKVEVLQDNVVKETYTDNYGNLSYTVDKELCAIGNNKITIRVTYDDNYTEEKVITYKHAAPPLPLETPLLDTVERVKLLTKSKQNEKNMLSNILTSKNVEVTEEDKMSDLIGKVDLLGEYCPPLYLYKEGDECLKITDTWTFIGFRYPELQTFTKESDNMHYYAKVGDDGNNKEFAITTNKAIDLTKYNKLNIEYENIAIMSNGGTGGQLYLRCNSTKPSSYSGTSVANISLSRNLAQTYTETLNISSVSGNMYVYLNGWGVSGKEFKIKNIWLEK